MVLGASTHREREVLNEEGESVLGVQRRHDVGEIIPLGSAIVDAHHNINLHPAALNSQAWQNVTAVQQKLELDLVPECLRGIATAGVQETRLRSLCQRLAGVDLSVDAEARSLLIEQTLQKHGDCTSG